MSRAWFTLACCWLALAAHRASAAPIAAADFAPGASVITFETGTTADPIIPGVNFVNTGGFSGSAAADFVGPEFGNQAYSNTVGGTFADLAIVFTTPQPAVGAWVGKITNFLNNPAEQMTLRVYGASGLLESQSVTLPLTLNVPTFAGIARPEGITRVEWIGNNTGFFAIDNVTYGAVVPEPGLIAWLAAPLILLARRRASRAVA